MKKSMWLVVFGAVAIGITLTYTVLAQQSSTPSVAVRPVALLDVNYVLSQNASIETQLAQLEEKYSKLMQATTQEGQEIAQLRDLLGTYQRNSDKYRETEQLMLSKSSGIDSKRVLLYKEMIEERMHIINDAHNKVLAQAERVARHYGMQVVLNFNRTKPLESAPLLNSAQQYEAFYQQHVSDIVIMRNIVWADQKTVDITTIVLNEIQKADPSTIRKTDTTAEKKAPTTGQVGSQVKP